MHALVVTVQIDPQYDAEAGGRNLQENVVPGVSRQPGFVSGVWLSPDATGEGLSVVIFESEAAARAGADTARKMFESGQVPPGVKARSFDVCEVAARG